MKNKSKKGFTLVEIMIVVVIIGLLAAMAIPAFSRVRENSIGATLDNDARQLASAANQFYLERAETSVDLVELVTDPTSNPNGFMSELSNNVTLVPLTGIAQGGTFTLSHPNFNGGTPVTYFVDTGRRQAAATDTTTDDG